MSKYEVAFTVTETDGTEHQLYWKYEYLGPLGRWTKRGISLYVPDNIGVYNRVQYSEIPQEFTPQLPEGMDPVDFAIREAVELFNPYIAANYNIDDDNEDPNGLTDEEFNQIAAGLVWNEDTNQFSTVV